MWIFHTIPHPGEVGYETWPPDAWKSIGGANCWAGMALDEKRGIVFVPTGSAAFDFWGGNRLGQNLFANCLLALDAATANESGTINSSITTSGIATRPRHQIF
jgi:quinoprotein glucose dehydrogenase